MPQNKAWDVQLGPSGDGKSSNQMGHFRKKAPPIT
jgi:hypothetical protein